MRNKQIIYRSIFFWVIVFVVYFAFAPFMFSSRRNQNNSASSSDSNYIFDYGSIVDSYRKENPVVIDFTPNDQDSPIQKFYREFFKKIIDNEPRGLSKLDQYYEECKLIGNDIGYWETDLPKWDGLSFDALNRCLKISNNDMDILTASHLQFVNSLEKKDFSESTETADLYHGDGIVVVGGGKFSILAFEMINIIRKHGSKMPVEIFIPPGESDPWFCEYVETNDFLNAKCIYLNKMFAPDIIKNYRFEGYQFKSLAILASSFEHLLLLDADNLPIVNIDDIFDNDVFREKGMVVWPDFWRRTTSPKYYDISGQKVDFTQRVRNFVDDVTPLGVYTPKPPSNKKSATVDPLKDIPMHDFANSLPDPSTESGQLMVNKKTHLKSLLLAFYYNVYGPNIYYPIFSQGTSGEGDKETFLAAAHFFELPYYQVKSPTGSDGYHKQDGTGYQGIAMYQKDFREDYEHYQKASAGLQQKYPEPEKAKYDSKYSPLDFHLTVYGRSTKSLFVHCNIPKFDPLMMYRNNENVYEGKHFRSFNNVVDLNGFDLELTVFQIFDKYICAKHDSANVKFMYLSYNVKDEQETKDMCDYVSTRYKYLQKNSLPSL